MSDKSKKDEILDPMQTCQCQIQLAGSRNNVVLRKNITVAEVIILQQLHGSSAVIDIVQTSTIDRNVIVEKQRLAAKYDRPVRKVVEDTFPGHSPQMPTTFKSAGIHVELAPEKPIEEGNIVPVEGGKAVVTTDADREEIAKEDIGEPEVIKKDK